MKTVARIFLGYFLLVGLGAAFLLNTFMAELRPGVRQSMEEVMVDMANLLAEVVQAEVVSANIEKAEFADMMQRFLARELNAKIWTLQKTATTLRVYVVDAQGTVVYDSDERDVGQDYSQWRDVYLTLRGQYGARSTRANPDDDTSTVMHVAAPIYQGKEIIGALTVAKPNISVQPFIEVSRQNMIRKSLLLLAVSLSVGLIFAFWFTHSTRKLVRYAEHISQGQRAVLPRISEAELAALGNAIEKMRTELEGKEYVENYIHTLTHEMKSPLSTIKGAVELLHEPMPATEQTRFLDNIQSETARLQQFIQRMLALAEVEKRQVLEQTSNVNLAALISEALLLKETILQQKNLQVKKCLQADLVVNGEVFLLQQAISNLLDNAIEFSPVAGTITIALESSDDTLSLLISDQGPGIPDFAKDRIFERFYSLAKPDSGKKSSGLGLSFVKEVAQLHQGSIALSNLPSGGVCAILTLPHKKHINHT